VPQTCEPNTNKTGQHWAKASAPEVTNLCAMSSSNHWSDQAEVAYLSVESSFMASHPLNQSDRRMFCQLVENYTKDVAFILQERMGQAAATAHVIDNMAVVIDLLFDETPPDEVAFALHTAITETAH
jgi:hypothetical protein